jgi:tetratricopeptide (TPR) repeat protein
MTAPIRFFISYSHADESLRAEIEKHLKQLKRQGLISVWHDRQCIGRTPLVDGLVTMLVGERPARVPILGPAGIGKSTVSLAALHRREVAARYGDRRYFVRLDAATSAEAAWVALATALRLPPGPELDARALAALAQGPAVIVLDNLETPWDGDGVGTEALLGELAALPAFGLVASVRGAAQPCGVAWSTPVRVKPLGAAEAIAVFCGIAGDEHRRDAALGALLEKQAGVPLAITLLAHAAQGNDLANLAEEWEARRTALLARDGRASDRMWSWAASLELSLGSRRMTAEARRLVALLAALPDGIAQLDLAALLPGGGPGAARVLAQMELAYFEGGRLQMLAPVREHVAATHAPRPEDLGRAMEHYGDLARELGPKPGRPGGREAAARLAPETANLDAMIRQGLESREQGGTERWIDSAIALTSFVRFSGHAQPSPLGRALEVARAAGDARREARCIERLGDIALARSQHEQARVQYEQALPLYRQVGSVLGETRCIERLGNIALRRSQHEQARVQYEQALPLYRQVGSVLGETNCINSLGDIALAKNDLHAAQARHKEALALYAQIPEPFSIGQTHRRLARLATDTAERRRYVDAARAAWLGIDRSDLVAELDREFSG